MIPTPIDTTNVKGLDEVSPPPSPPPIHSLYTEGSIYRRSHVSPLPTRNNKASIHTGSTWYERRSPPLLVPKTTDLPPPNNAAKPTTRRQRVYGYMRSLAIYLLKQLLKKNNLALVINLIHQAWRARFFVSRTIRMAHETLTTFPRTDEYAYYRDAMAQAGRLILTLAKREQRQVLIEAAKSQHRHLGLKQRLGALDLRQTAELAHVYMTLILTHVMDVSRFGLYTVIRAIRHLGAWDSLAMAITSVALTRSLQNPSHWM